jgi:hypothetical protein
MSCEYHLKGEANMKSRLSTTLFLVIVADLLILASSLIYWVAVARPAQLHAQATATAARDATATSIAQARSTAQAEAQATSLAVSIQILLGEIYNKATSGTPTITDPLQAQDSNDWGFDNPDKGFSCTFAGGMDVKAPGGYFETCQARAANFSNLAFQVEMRIVSGHSGGLVIRSDANGSGYYFRISTDGTFLGRSVVVHTQQPSVYTPLFAGQSPAVKTGNDQFNQITVIALGSELFMYVNQQYVAKISDSTYTSGRIGVYADSDTGGSEILFRNAQVWKL